MRVQWEESARDELASAWLNAETALRAEITAATDRLDRALARDPYQDSESREENCRIMFEAPVGVLFRVDDGDQVVYVVRFWTIPRKSE